MKKGIILFAIALLTATSAMAQHEIGIVAGGLNGVSYKYWFSDRFALQADLAVGLSRVPGGTYYKGNKVLDWTASIYDFTLNPNLAYHFDLPANFRFYVGGGLNLGLMSGIENTNPDYISGKFGLNALVGAAYRFDGAPIVLALDFRPGYGLGFTKADHGHDSFFDWKLALAVRYCL
jgi:hypothetical protein